MTTEHVVSAALLNKLPLMSLAVWIALGLVVLLLLYGVITYNRFVTLRNRIENAWAQIDVQLQRRHDLIPNLVETVKGYASHERATLQAVVEARNMAMAAQGPAEQGQAENMLSGALKSLFALSEAYPDLKANSGFLQLQEELSATEGKIAYARQFYNDVVNRYNTLTETFPSVIIANVANFEQREYFETDETGRQNIQVSFDAAPAAPPAAPTTPPAQPTPPAS